MFRNKILVEIFGENGILIKRKRFPIEQNKVIIRKASVGRGKIGYAPEFEKDSILFYNQGIFPFKRLQQKLMLRDGAEECMIFKKKEGVEMAVWDRETEEKFFEAHVIKSAGATTQKVQVPFILYVLVGLCFVIGVINLIASSGRVRIG